MPPGTKVLSFLAEELDPSIQRLVEGFFFRPNHFLDVRLTRADFRKHLPHRFRQHINKLIKERFVKTERSPITHCASQDAAQDIMPIVVSRKNSVRNCETEGADMICDHVKG